MSIGPQEVVTLLNERLTRILTIAEAALPPQQFKAFRKLVLDEMGRNGMEAELHRLFEEHGR